MDDQVKQHLMSYLDKLESAVQKGADIAAEQLPLALQEYIAYCRIDSTVGLATALIFLSGGLLMTRKGVKGLPEMMERDSSSPVPLVFSLVGAILAFGGLIAASANYSVCIKSWVAPRVLLLEKVNELRK